MAAMRLALVVAFVALGCASATYSLALAVTVGFEAVFAAIQALPEPAPAPVEVAAEEEEEGEPLFLGVLDQLEAVEADESSPFFAPRFGTGSKYGKESVQRSAGAEKPSRTSTDDGWANDVWRGRPYFGNGFGSTWAIPEP